MAASASDKFMKTGTSTATTLSAPGYTIGNTSITVASTTNWPTDTGVVFAIDVAEIVDGEQVRVAGTYCEFVGTVASATSITNVSLTLGTPQNYAAGALTRVYIPVSSEHVERMVDGILADHSQAGAHEVATNYDPANPTLETQKWAGVASAVNEITVSNAATGSGPEIQATGGDTNIDIELVPKGTGKVLLDSFYSWQRGTGTWTYASATTFTVPTVDAALMSVGTKIWLTQTSSKYFYVTGVSGTTITVTGGSDYSVANAAITAPYFSNAATPVGFPQYFNWTPSFTNLTVGNGTLTAYFAMIGKLVHTRVRLVFGSTTSVSGSITVTNPVTPHSSYNGARQSTGNCHYEDNGTAGYFGAIQQSTGGMTPIVLVASATYTSISGINATIPFTWTTNDSLQIQVSYEAA